MILYKWCERTSGWAYAQKSNCNPNSKKQQTSAGSRWYDGFICICICLYICIYICICICVVAGVQCASQPRFVRASFVRERKEGAPLSSRTSCQTFIQDIQQLLKAHLESFTQKLKTILISLHTISIQSLEKVFCLFPPQPRFSSRLENNCTTHWRNDGNIILSWFFEKESHESLKVGHLDSVGLSTNWQQCHRGYLI